MTSTTKHNLYDLSPVPSSFQELVTALEGKIHKKIKKVLFQDDEGDFVSITNTLEYEEAVDFSLRNEEVNLELTLHVTDEPILESKVDLTPKTNEVLESSPVEHCSTCDSCNFAIFGIRYKCANCLNYDLCSACEKLNQSNSIHNPDHIFLKIYKPLIAGYPQFTIPNLYKSPSDPKPSGNSTPLSRTTTVENRLTKVESQIKELQRLISEKDKRKLKTQIQQGKGQNTLKKMEKKKRKNCFQKDSQINYNYSC